MIPVTRFYTALLYVLVPFILLRLAWRGLRNPAYWQRIPERFGFFDPPTASGAIWIHAVSVGEVRAAAPLVRELRSRYPEREILITTMTPTGAAQVLQVYDGEIPHRYVPYDLPSVVRRFLDRVQPAIAIVMETELWPNLFRLCHEREIPLVITNMRLSARSARAYRRIARIMGETLSRVSAIAAQSAADAERIRSLGAPSMRVHVTGSIKFELNLPASLKERAEVLRGLWGRDRPTWLAASTHDGEEEHVLRAFHALKFRFPNQLLVLVPRHPERFASVARLCRREGFKVALRSEQPGAVDPATEILLGDTMGELQIFYAACDVAFIGGSLVPVGGHNLLEASAVGKPVVMGPQLFNFTEISAMAIECGAAVRINQPGELASALSDFLGNANRRFEVGEAGRRLVEENRGALNKTMALIAPLLGEAPITQ